MHVVDDRRDRLADVGAVESVAQAPGKPGNDGTLDLFLQIEDGVVAFLAERTAEMGHVAPRGRRQRRVAPAAQCQRHDTADPRVQAHQVDKGIFGHPVDWKVRAMPHDVGYQRQCVHDIAERAGPNDEDAAHRARPAKRSMRVECKAQTT